LHSLSEYEKRAFRNQLTEGAFFLISQHQIKVSGSRLVLKIFGSTAFASNLTICGSDRAFSGQTDMQRIQRIHLLLSVFCGAAAEIAPAGQFAAQSPQFVQFFPV